MKHSLSVVGVLALSLSLLSGCSDTKTPPSNQTNTIFESLYPVSENVKDLSHPDGTIASLVPYHVQGQNPYIKLYKMFYWSAGEKVEAFVAKPTNQGKYPLLIGCHGGYVSPLTQSHATQLIKPSDLAQDSGLYVEVDPMYRGYQDSQGTVQNVSQNTLDAENAIRAADTFKDVNSYDVYVTGSSMGGEVALMLAERPDVKAVVAISPWVGWNINLEWALKNENHSKLAVSILSEATAAYGSFNPNSHVYKRESPDVTKIKAPVLLLQGTGDNTVAWQTVQTFANQLKAAGKTVRFELYPGGLHGLNGKYARDKVDEINTWYTEYGLNLY